MKKPSPKKPIPPEVQVRLDALERLIDAKFEGKQAVFHRKTGVSLSQIGQWYTGERLLRENALDTLVEKTGIPRSYFDCKILPEVGNVNSADSVRGVSETIEHLGKLLDALPAEKQPEAAQRLGALALGDSEKNRAALVALLSPTHSATETADFAGKPSATKANQPTPSFLK